MGALEIALGILIAVFVYTYRVAIFTLTWWLFRLTFTVIFFGGLGLLATLYAGQ